MNPILADQYSNTPLDPRVYPYMHGECHLALPPGKHPFLAYHHVFKSIQAKIGLGRKSPYFA